MNNANGALGSNKLVLIGFVLLLAATELAGQVVLGQRHVQIFANIALLKAVVKGGISPQISPVPLAHSFGHDCKQFDKAFGSGSGASVIMGGQISFPGINTGNGSGIGIS